MNESGINNKIMPGVNRRERQPSIPWHMMVDVDVEGDFLYKKVSYTHLAIINRLIAAQSSANYGTGDKKRNNRFIDSKESMPARQLEESYYDNKNSNEKKIYNIKSCGGIEYHDSNYIHSIKLLYKEYLTSDAFKEYKNTKDYEKLCNMDKNLNKKQPFKINDFALVYFNYDDDEKVEVPGMRKFVNKYYDFLNKEENKGKYGDVNTKYWTGTIHDVIINLYKFIKENFGVVGQEDKDKDSDGELSVKSKFVRYMPSLLNEEKLPVYCTIDDYERSEEMIKFINNDTRVKYYNFLTHQLCNSSDVKIHEDYAFTGGKKTSRRQKRKSKRKSTKRRTKRKLRRKNTKK